MFIFLPRFLSFYFHIHMQLPLPLGLESAFMHVLTILFSGNAICCMNLTAHGMWFKDSDQLVLSWALSLVLQGEPPPPKKKNKTTKRSKREGGGGRERAEGNSWIKDERNGCFSCCVPVLSCLFCLLPWILLKEWELHFQFSCPTWDTLLQLQVSNCNTAANRKMEAKIRMSSPCPHATKVSLWWVTVQHIPKNFSKRELPDALSQAS